MAETTSEGVGRDTFGEYAFQVRAYECNRHGFATLPTICNYLQEAASRNAEELGFSKSDFAAAGNDISWVLTKMKVRMNRYPKWEDEVKVLTFPRSGRKIVAWRDFAITDGAGEELGVATTEWMLIDLATRKVVPIPRHVFDAANTVREPVLGAEPFTRFRYPGEAGADGELRFTAQHAQIDLNGHVNNVHYIAWMLEPLPGCLPKEMEIVFRSETFAGDEVRVRTAPGDAGETYHRVFSADGRDHVTAITVC